MSHRWLILGSAVLAFNNASVARATLFSFASDTNSSGYTFTGTPGAGSSFTLTDFSRPNTFILLVDDDNGPLGSISIPVEFRASLTASGGQSTLVAGSLYQHSYLVSGMFGFYDAGGNALVTVNIGAGAPAVLTVPGTQNAWASSGAVLGADSFADVSYTATSALVTAMGGVSVAAQYGIMVSGGATTSVGPDDFGFDLSVINTGTIGLNVGIDPATKAPITAWRSEASYSGSALGGIPTPATCSLFGIATVVANTRGRRRK